MYKYTKDQQKLCNITVEKKLYLTVIVNELIIELFIITIRTFKQIFKLHINISIQQ